MSITWAEVTFGDVFDISSSKRVLEEQWASSGVPFYRAREVVKLSKEGRVANDLFITEQLYAELGRKTGVPNAGDLMVSAVGTLGACYVVQPSDRFYFKDASVLWFKPKQEVSSRFIWHAFQTRAVQEQIRSGSSSTVGTYTISRARETRLPLPPLVEQHRIAAILDKADALRAKRREAIAKLDQLLQSVFLHMFGDQTTNPKSWPIARIDEVAECLDRFRKPVTAKDRAAGDVPYYGANGQQGWIDKPIFDEPLVLVAEDGGHFEQPERGVAYRIDGPAWVNNHAHILRAKPDVIDTEYLHRALRHFDFMPYISGSTRAKLTQGQLNAVPVLVPPIDTQRKFACAVTDIRSQGRLLHSSAAQLDILFASLQHRAFTGTL